MLPGILLLDTGKRYHRHMPEIVTLRERKADEAARRSEAVAALRPVLTAYARAHGGRFLLYGSAARGCIKYAAGFSAGPSARSMEFRRIRVLGPGA